MMTLMSACGRNFDIVDEYVYDSNPHGYVCCADCRTVIESREAWAFLALSDLDAKVGA